MGSSLVASPLYSFGVRMGVGVCGCVRACVRARACVRVCVRACVRASNLTSRRWRRNALISLETESRAPWAPALSLFVAMIT